MKHVVIIGKYYPPEFGGMERYAYDVARVAAKSYRVTVLVHNKGKKDSVEQHANISVIRCGTTKVISSQPISLSMLAHLRSLKPDLVQFNAPNFWAAAMLLLASYDGPLIITHHADVFGRPLLKRAVLPIYRHLIHRATCIVTNSLKNARLSDDLPKNAGLFVQIPHGVDAHPYLIDERDQETILTQRRQMCGEAPVVGFIGRFVRYKGLSVLVDALARLNGVHVLMIGDGPLKAQTEQQARALGIAERMHFLGNLEEVDKIRMLAMIDILVLPSVDTTETFGVAQIEAQLMGLPVIASRLETGVTDVTVDNRTGLLVSPRDPSALADAISKLISDGDLASRLGRAGRSRALKNFSFDAFEQRYSELFKTIFSGPLEDASSRFALSRTPFGRLKPVEQ